MLGEHLSHRRGDRGDQVVEKAICEPFNLGARVSLDPAQDPVADLG
jgi:hypothetical protein